MGLSSSKTKTKTTNDPYAAAVPAINAGIQATQQVFNAQQPILDQNAALAQQAYQNLASQAFQTSPYVGDAQKTAQKISSGSYFSQNPGAATYADLMSGAASTGHYDGIGTNNPSLAALQAMMTQGPNPADVQARATASGQYLNGQPSAGFYADTLAGKYLNANPYLDAIVRQSDDVATKAVNQRFAASGMGAGISTPYADLLSRNLADSENQLRYGAYNNELNRMGTIGAQSDNAWSGERGRMDAANGQLAADYNANQDRALAAANGLGSQYNASGQLQLDAQKASDASRLGAAQAADAQQNQQASQILQALGLTSDLSNAQYAGVAPALNLLSTASQIPYYGLSAYAGDLDSLAGKYGTTNSTQTTSGLTNLLNSLSGLGSALGGSGGLLNGIGGLMKSNVQSGGSG